MSTPGGAAPTLRRRRLPGQGKLLAVAALLIVGAMLPWMYTGVGNYNGFRVAGPWTFYAGFLALGGGLLPHRALAAGSAIVAALPAVGLPLWQLLHMFRLVGTAGWMPGPGTVLTVGGGVLALVTARRLLSAEASAAPRPGGPPRR